MPFDSIIWDLDDDPNGNVRHRAEHGIEPHEVEEVLQGLIDFDVSRTTGYPVAFGDTAAGRHLLVVFERIDEATVYPITAYEVERRHAP